MLYVEEINHRGHRGGAKHTEMEKNEWLASNNASY